MIKRNYKKEYKDFHGTKKQIKNRTLRNQARSKMGVKKGDTREVDHKRSLKDGGGNNKDNLRIVTMKTNREKGAK